jgi:transcriptional regulator with XRE-family HTH domain
VPPRRKSIPRSPEHATLGEAIRRSREELALSQEELADAADMHITHLGGLERGVRNPSYATLLKLAKALRIEPGALVSLGDALRQKAKV